MGTTGEANSLGIGERIALLEGLVARGMPGARMLPGTGTTAITDTVLLTRKAREIGCRGALLLPPFYYKNPSDDGLLAYFSEVIERVGGGICLYLYNFPQQSAIPFSVDFFARLLRAYPAVFKGVKDSSAATSRTASLCRGLRPRRVRGLCRRRHAAAAAAAARRRRLHHRGGQHEFARSAAQVYANWDNAAGEAATATLARHAQGRDLGAADPRAEGAEGARTPATPLAAASARRI